MSQSRRYEPEQDPDLKLLQPAKVEVLSLEKRLVHRQPVRSALPAGGQAAGTEQAHHLLVVARQNGLLEVLAGLQQSVNGQKIPAASARV